MKTNNLDIRMFQTLYTDDRFASLLRTVDRLHDIVIDGKLAQVTNLPTDEIIGWLKGIAYTVSETIRELEDSQPGATAADAWRTLVRQTAETATCTDNPARVCKRVESWQRDSLAGRVSGGSR